MALVWGLGVARAQAGRAQAGELSRRWINVFANFNDSRAAVQAVEVVERAAGLGINGVIVGDVKLVTLELYGYDQFGSTYRRNIDHFMTVCRRLNLAVVVSVPVVSRGSGILAYDVNLAAGYEVRDAEFGVKDGEARLLPDLQARLVNGDFEESEGDRLIGWGAQDVPGRATVVDREVVRSGRQSLRLEPAGSQQNGMCRVSQQVTVTPHRCYRASVWVRTEDLAAPGYFSISIADSSTRVGRRLAFTQFDIKPTQPWTQMEAVFNSLDATEVNIHFGVWRGVSGRAWLDDGEVREMGLTNVLRRPGCPLTVRDADASKTYVEGEDYEPVVDPLLGRAKGWAGAYDRYHAPPPIRFKRAIADGTRLRVSYYHPLLVNREQVDCCMSEPAVYEIFERQIARLDRLLDGPDGYLLSYSELRTGGGCRACQSRGMTPGAMLAESIRRLAGIVRKVNPKAEVGIWHDMVLPEANARDDYYLVQGSLAGSWEGLDKEMVVYTWARGDREGSARFFGERGMRQMACPHVDIGTDRQALFDDWLETAGRTPGMLGIVYFTERKDYSDLDLFSRAVARHRSRPAGSGR